jgi:hypothetical protein
VHVAVAGGGADGHHRRQDARARYDPLPDGVAQADVELVVAPQVADGGEAGEKRSPGVDRGADGNLGERHLEEVELVLAPVVRDLGGDVGMGVDQAGEEGGVAEVDHPGPGRNGRGWPGGQDAVPLDHDHARRREAVRSPVEEAGGADDHRSCGRGRGSAQGQSSDQQ